MVGMCAYVRVCVETFTCICVCVFNIFNAGFAFKKACFLCGGMVGVYTHVSMCVCVCVCEYMHVKETHTDRWPLNACMLESVHILLCFWCVTKE